MDMAKRRGRVPRVGASPPRPAVALEEVVDPGAGALERPIRGRDVLRERLDAAGRLRALVHAHPDAWPVHDLAAAEPGTAARTVAHLLGAGLWTHVFHVAQHAVAAGLAAEHRLLHH